MGSLFSCFRVAEAEENVESNHGNCICPSCLTHSLKTKCGALFGRVEVYAAPSHGQETAASSSSKRLSDKVLMAGEVRPVSPLPEEEDVFSFDQKQEEEDVCPVCLEEYTPGNPKKTTECHHNYHLQCIFEWQERSEKCPVCEKVIVCEKLT